MRCVKWGSFILLAIAIMIGMRNYTVKKTDNSKAPKVILNERQKEILFKEGLSTNYEELELSQQMAIVAIEDMLKYVENKYDIPFKYSGYIAASPLEPEQLKAYPVLKDKVGDRITVTKTDEGYEDDYISIASNDIYTSYILTGIQDLIPETMIKVYTEITKTSLLKVPEDGKDFDGTTEAAIFVFIDGATCSEDDFLNLINNCKSYLSNHNLYSLVQFIRMKEDMIKFVTGSNFDNYLSEEYFYTRESVHIKK
ncbi:MAG: hypothetical protein K2P09_01965 [Erysipelotrichales bacterium]|nr:hypothetical protein [Erysipelotrichales bacterium]